MAVFCHAAHRARRQRPGERDAAEHLAEPGQPYAEFLHERILSPLRLITTGYGYGMFTGMPDGQAAYYHPGDNPGYRSFSGWIPDRAATIVILANDENVDTTDVLRQLLPAALEP